MLIEVSVLNSLVKINTIAYMTRRFLFISKVSANKYLVGSFCETNKSKTPSEFNKLKLLE